VAVEAANGPAQLSLGGIVTNLPAVRVAKNVNTKFNCAASILRNVDCDTETTTAGSPRDRLAKRNGPVRRSDKRQRWSGKRLTRLSAAAFALALYRRPPQQLYGLDLQHVASLAMISSPG
jgi:hypothetical protein